MKDDFFKQLDPAVESNDPLLVESRQAWKTLAAKRRSALQWRRRGIVAAACAIVAGCLLYAGFPDREAPIASVEKHVVSEERNVGNEALRSATPSPTNQASRKETQAVSLTLAAFKQELQRAEKIGTPQWKKVVASLATSPMRVQRESIALVSRIDDHKVKLRAMQLVGEAAGKDESRLLVGWLNQSRTRDAAWQRCVAISSSDDWFMLSSLARSEAEKRLLCERIWKTANQQSADALVQLVALPQWRRAVRSSGHTVPADWTLRLVKELRHRNVKNRTAIAFVLASIPGDQIDRGLAEMVTQGRYQQPCYLTLMSRDTTVARSFLAHAARQRALTPALLSAQSHFNVMAPELKHWKELSQGDSHEESLKKSDRQSAVNASRLAYDRFDCRDVGEQYPS